MYSLIESLTQQFILGLDHNPEQLELDMPWAKRLEQNATGDTIDLKLKQIGILLKQKSVQASLEQVDVLPSALQFHSFKPFSPELEQSFLLAKENAVFLEHWLKHSAREDEQVPSNRLLETLELTHQYAQFYESLLQLCGERGLYILPFKKQWKLSPLYLNLKKEYTPEEQEELWLSPQLKDRQRVFKYWREQDPLKTLKIYQEEVIGKDNAEVRETLLKCFEYKLSSADLPLLLELAQKERSQNIKAKAKHYLLQLEDSPIRIVIDTYLKTVFELKKGTVTYQWKASSEVPQELYDFGFERTSNLFEDERDFMTYQLIESLPSSYFSTLWHQEASEWSKALSQKQMKSLLPAFHKSMLRDQDPFLAEVLYGVFLQDPQDYRKKVHNNSLDLFLVLTTEQQLKVYPIYKQWVSEPQLIEAILQKLDSPLPLELQVELRPFLYKCSLNAIYKFGLYADAELLNCTPEDPQVLQTAFYTTQKFRKSLTF